VLGAVQRRGRGLRALPAGKIYRSSFAGDTDVPDLIGHPARYFGKEDRDRSAHRRIGRLDTFQDFWTKAQPQTGIQALNIFRAVL
jgi:hypothetical protein